MRTIKIIQRVCGNCREIIHPARFRAVTQVVEAATVARKLTLTGLARAMRSSALVRHRIKKVDRLLGNPKVQAERLHWFRALAERLSYGQRRLVVLLDWTQIHGDFWALVASVPSQGRSIPVLAQAHEHSEVGSPQVHQQFLFALRRILPRTCRPVIVADGGFRSPFFLACMDASMDFVVRLRNERSVAAIDGSQIKFSDLFQRATRVAQCLGEARPYASSRDSVGLRMVLGPKQPKANLRRKYRDDYERKRATEPWLLATSLDNDAAQTIVALYGQRMKIEESFRDAKCPRFGWALKHSGTRSKMRLDALLLIAALAMAITLLVGAAGDQCGIEKTLRASSSAARQLSLFSIGAWILALKIRVPFHIVWSQFKRTRQQNAAAFPKITPPSSANRTVPLPLPHGLFCSDCGWNGAQLGWPP